MMSRFHRYAPLALAFLLAGPAVTARADDEAPARLATSGRFDLTADFPIEKGRVVAGDGSIGRMNWVPADRAGSGYTVNFGLGRLGWRPLAVAFTPAKSGTVSLALMGPWEQAPKGGVYRQEILWDDLRVEGAELAADGGFESRKGWEGAGKVEAATKAVPALSGAHFGRTWHDQTLATRLAVRAGVPVVVHVQALARTPEGYQDMKRVAGRDTPAHRNAKKFLRGANLGNGLEVAPGQNWGVKYTVDDVKKIKAEGFDHIRVPIGWHHYAGPAPEYKLSPVIFKKVDYFVDAADREGLAALINIHHFDDFTTDPAGQQAKFLAIWRQVSEHYAKRPNTLAFELLNESKDAGTTEVVNPIFAEAIKIIRKADPDRLIVVGPGRWNSISELPALRLPDDDHNILVTVHSYDPFFFSHQGASWTNRGDDGKQKGIKFPGPPASPLVPDPSLHLTPGFLAWVHDYNTAPAGSNPCGPEAMDKAAAQIKEWSDHYGRPVYLGEFGAIMQADPESRANYYREFRKRLEKAGVGWALWDWHAGFNYWDVEDDRPQPGMHEALFGKP
ncbi:glycoside hydrolase family 5 protein [Paludisphaera mucosa]|uniref:Glycoside hydrolase family 5 protein n=1 Tax=Paludisphaera mucosa TaxID=3030827 RepID=A0ABT6FHW8_9BACT|nr:glycoside hydrolase family 5 protein [Paludisphaera mucosa]MDG3007188.1 glycoside hydrolase family 5 protein [Paludisphaera mucosa]